MEVGGRSNKSLWNLQQNTAKRALEHDTAWMLSWISRIFFQLEVNMSGTSFINKYVAKGKQRQPKHDTSKLQNFWLVLIPCLVHGPPQTLMKTGHPLTWLDSACSRTIDLIDLPWNFGAPAQPMVLQLAIHSSIPPKKCMPTCNLYVQWLTTQGRSGWSQFRALSTRPILPLEGWPSLERQPL